MEFGVGLELSWSWSRVGVGLEWELGWSWSGRDGGGVGVGWEGKWRGADQHLFAPSNARERARGIPRVSAPRTGAACKRIVETICFAQNVLKTKMPGQKCS